MRYREDLTNLLGTPSEQIIRISAKEGLNVDQVLESIIT